jgi:transketolase C-terminal domain/subunit
VRLGVNDTFGESGSADELLAKHGLDAAGIAAAVRRALSGEIRVDGMDRVDGP